MVNKQECISIFNAMIRGTPTDKLIILISDYLTEIKCEKSDKMINLIVQNPQLIQQVFPQIVEYYCRKYNILSIKKVDLNNLYINSLKTILYYE
jgi:Zn finger protein HypA/HybF involved in hydrogenase expression